LESHPKAMATPQPAQAQRPAPRLYLVTPAIEDPSAMADALASALAEADVAAVLLRLKPADERTLINRVKALAEIVQPAGAALVLDGHADIVARAGADGAHLTGIEAFAAALDGLKPARIAGCGGLQSRDDAMVAAERGADYVMFGEPDEDGRRPSFEAIVERVEWWAEVFEVPCVGFAESLDEAARLAAAGAEFVAVGESLWNGEHGAARATAALAAHIAAPEAVP
jgi:thiamine-phosphate pyrophosphorylase